MISYLYLVLMRSAAFRNMAARSAKGKLSHAGFAASAESIACLTSSEEALEHLATEVEKDEGFACVTTLSVVTLPRTSMRHCFHFSTSLDVLSCLR